MFAAHDLTVLCIHQDNDLRQKSTELMRENGLRVFGTDNTTQGCDLFRQHGVDIVMIDLELPEQSGLNFIRCLRDKDVLTPVIITTDHTDRETLFEAINLDITRYLIKPCKDEDILDALQMAIKKAINCHPLTFSHLKDGFTYDPINKSVTKPDKTTVQLSKKEYLLIELLLKNKYHIVPYDAIEMLVRQESIMTMDALRTLIRGIRKKTYPHIIANHNGIGYKINI